LADKKNYLIFVNSMGPNYLGNYMYEFIFGPEVNDVDGEEWGYEGKGEPPHQEYIGKVGVLENSKVNFEVAQKHNSFTMYDAQEDVIALAWESYEGIDEEFKSDKRLVFHYGEEEKLVTEKLYSRDMKLKIKDI
jgi:hypothetical protein